MQKKLLLVMCLGMVSGISAGDAPLPAQAGSYMSQVFSSAKTKMFGYVALAGAGVFGLYKLATYALHQEEERMFDEPEEELEAYEVSQRDLDTVRMLIEAMEKDTILFDAKPSCVNGLEFGEFDNEEMASGCKGLREAFCAVYEQCQLEPENKPLLEEFVMIFKQTIDEKMVAA